MKRSDLWGKPAVNGKLRAGFSSQRAIGDQAEAAFERFAALNSPALERLLKKSIPVLIIAFLICVALARGFSLISSHTRMEDTVRQTTTLTAMMAYSALANEPTLFIPGNGEEASARLKELLTLGNTGPDTDLLIIGTDGKVMAATGSNSMLVGRPLASVFPNLVSARRTPASVSETRIDGVPYLVSLHLAGDNGGMIAALHATSRMNAQWRAEVNLNVTLFAAMALLLLVVVYAYYGQLSRADTTSGKMEDERLARDTMLANGEAGLWSFDAKKRSVALDGSASVALGLGSGTRTLSYRVLLSLVHPEDRTGLARALHPSEDGLIEARLRLRQYDDCFALFDIRAHAASRNGKLSISGAVIRAAGCQHRETEAATRRARRLQAALEALPQPLALWHRNGRLEAANQAFRDAYTLNPLATDIRHTDIEMHEDKDCVIVRRSHHGGAGVVETKTASGKWLLVSETETATGGRITACVDITRFKDDQCRLQAEQERLREKINGLTTSGRHLEQKCASLLQELDGTQQGQPSLQTLHANDQTGIASEFRTSLTTILGFSELLLAETGKPRSCETRLADYARSVQQGGAMLQALIEKLEMTQQENNLSEGGVVIRRTLS